MGTIYFICFDKPIGNEKHAARHYLGWTTNLESRLEAHKNGQGAAIMTYLHQQHIGWRLAFVIENVPQKRERQMKNWKKGPKLCPFCSGKIRVIDFDEIDRRQQSKNSSRRSGRTAPNRKSECEGIISEEEAISY